MPVYLHISRERFSSAGVTVPPVASQAFFAVRRAFAASLEGFQSNRADSFFLRDLALAFRHLLRMLARYPDNFALVHFPRRFNLPNSYPCSNHFELHRNFCLILELKCQLTRPLFGRDSIGSHILEADGVFPLRVLKLLLSHFYRGRAGASPRQEDAARSPSGAAVS